MIVTAYGTQRAVDELRTTPGVEVLNYQPDTERYGHIQLDVAPEAMVYLQQLTENRDSGIRKVTRKEW